MTNSIELKLTNSDQVALVDECDRTIIEGKRWFINQGYVATSTYIGHYKTQKFYLARLILGLKGKEIVDHINGNRLDNRRSNLRVSSFAANSLNRLKQKTNVTSKYKGVYYHKKNKVWISYISFKGRRYHLGCFKTEEEAAIRYNQECVKFDPLARLNQIS